MTSQRLGWRALLGAALVIAAFAAQAQDALLERARQLLETGKPGEAYALLEPQAERYAGNATFDLVLGRAALESNHPVEAVFALERVIDQQPDNAVARAHLARAYLRIGENDSAQAEFERVRAQSIPTDVAATIDKYLAVIQYELDAARTRYDVYVKMGLGYDSNVNAATDRETVSVVLPGGGVNSVPLAPGSQETDAGIWQLGGGFSFASPLRKDLRLYGGINYDGRLAIGASEFSSQTVDGNLGLHWLRGKDQFRVAAQGQKYFIDGNTPFRADREYLGATGQWQRTVSDNTQLTAYLQGAMVRYPEQDVRDVDRFAAGAGLGHAFDGRGTPVVYASVFGGFEEAKDDANGEHFGRDFVGVRAGGEYTLTSRAEAFGSLTYQYSDYDAPVPFFGEREDDFYDIGGGVNYRWMGHWTVTPQVRYTNNSSTVDVNDYDRVLFLVTVRNDF